MISQNTLSLIEFDKLLKLVSAHAHSDASEKAVLEILPLTDITSINERAGIIQEIRRVTSDGTPLVLLPFSDLSPNVARARPHGAVLDGLELTSFIPVFEMLFDLSSHLREHTELPQLSALAADLTGYPDILRVLKKSVDSSGNVLDSASSKLSGLRKSISRLEMNIQRKLEELTRDSSTAVFLQDDFITKKAGRWVIPVRMDSKGQVPGVVHDVSRSGETAFIEPISILGISNELENLVAEEKAEEIRILRELSSLIREHAGGIEREYAVLVRLDMLNCIALFADRMDMTSPLVNDSGIIHISGARHPLLLSAFRSSDNHREVVPLNVGLGTENNTVMVITGSNAGGKTVSIKTIGILTAMALAGMPVPADSSSNFPLISQLLIDIGDEQSIESSLSTFSAHVSNIAGIIERADDHALVLIDELGTGTDPDEGAALSCAVLNQLQSSGALVFATTHLTGIKGFVHRTAGMINAAMEFDQKNLVPLYRLRIGEPGQSHAMEIAKKYGMPDSIITKAKELIGGINIEFENLIAEMQTKRDSYETLLQELGRRQEEMELKQKQLDRKQAEAEETAGKLLEKAYLDAHEIVAQVKREMHARLDEMKKADKESIRRTIKEIEKKQKMIAEQLEQAGSGTALSMDSIRKGDDVFVRSLGYDATVTEVMQKLQRVRIRAGNLEFEIPFSDLRAARGRYVAGKPGLRKAEKTGDDMVPSRINMVGLRVDEALSRLEPFLNHASLAGYTAVTVIHGIGKGLLARAVREHLDGHPLVKKFRAGNQGEGGSGVTIVELA